jgi:3-oxoacyl-[acyl-carrier protein] reductase
LEEISNSYEVDMELGLAGRVALVTGGSQGIGRAAALAFAQEGARVGLTYRHERERADAVVAQVEAAGGEAHALAADLERPETIAAAAHRLLEHWGRIDVLVNNAVMWGERRPWDAPPFEALPADEWRSVYRANSEGPFTAIQAVVPAMREQRWGRIVNVSSGVAEDGVPGGGAYGAAKAALHGLTRTLCKELGPTGILVNVVIPGVTLTERMAATLPPAVRRHREQVSPIRRLLPPEEVVPTIVFLGSAANTAVTGEVVRAGGGRA